MRVYKERNTNNIVTLLNGELDANFIEITANEEDASLEKHVPVYTLLEDKIVVSIGEVIHPMEESHYIMWIALDDGKSFTLKHLKPSDNPTIEFDYIKGSTVYAYCNLHGLWKKEVE